MLEERLKQLHIRGWIGIDEFEEKAIPLRDKRETILSAATEEDKPARYARALAFFESMPEEGASEAEIRAAWRRLVLSSIESITVPVELPPDAQVLVQGDATALRITLDAPLYRRTYREKRLLFGTIIDTDTD